MKKKAVGDRAYIAAALGDAKGKHSLNSTVLTFLLMKVYE